MAQDNRFTVYYDAACPACRREVGFYQRRDRKGRIAWVDISQGPADLARDGVTGEQALDRIHARMPDGRLITGARVFVEIWKRIPGLRWVTPIAGSPPALAVMEPAYGWFAKRRRRITGRERCTDATCRTP
jgi:predicted DCC family thiol-disulfide oxidoreductase YuxK